MSDGSLFNLDAFGSAPPSEPAESHEPTTHATAAPGSAPSGPASLYRKYRPQSFDSAELFGQQHVVNTLRNAIRLDRIAHAYLFCGPRGTGKTTTARLLAKAVNCLDPDPDNRPCNHCEACVAINAGATTDVIEIDAASNRGIDDIRDLRERVKYAPSQLRTKFYIIDEAHQITGAAANAFLKTLEEPPAHTKFVLATTDPEELLQTIVSRCQRFDFRRFDLQTTVACMTRVADAEGIQIDEDAKAAIARHATGSMRDALGLLDQVSVYRENADDPSPQVTLDLVRVVLGVSRNDRVETIVRALAERNAKAGIDAISDAVEAGDDVRQLARQLLAYLRQLLLARAGSQTELDDAGQALARQFELADLAALTRQFGDIDFRVKRAIISQLPLEIAVVEAATRGIAAPTSTSPLPSGARNSPAPESTPASPPAGGSWRNKVRGERQSAAPAPSTQTESTAADPEPQTRTAPERAQTPAPRTIAAPATVDGSDELERLNDLWERVRADVKAVNRRIEALLQQTGPARVSGKQITLVTPYEFHRNKINEENVRIVIEDVIQRHVGYGVSVVCVSRAELETMPAPTGPNGASPSQTSGKDDEVDTETTPDPVDERHFIDTSRQIEAVKNIFDGEEIPNKPGQRS